MLIDKVEVTIIGGHGGPGAVTFNPGRFGGPSGGNGGKGGSVILKATSDLTALNQFSKTKLIEAENGKKGLSQKRFGEDGKDKTVLVPVGTEVIDQETDEIFELTEVDQEILICKGGLGGRGNFEFRSPRNTTPMYAQPGLPGKKRKVTLNLKLIADYGLIGLPNAGKSSLLNELTEANAKIGNYAFTTLEPNLGVYKRKIVADLPGLIEGASTGKGLGDKFLKHIEKVGLLLHCVSAESEDVVKDYQVIRNELSAFSDQLTEKKEIILLTKVDLVDPNTAKDQLKRLKKFKKEIIPVSIHDWDSLEKLKKVLI